MTPAHWVLYVFFLLFYIFLRKANNFQRTVRRICVNIGGVWLTNRSSAHCNKLYSCQQKRRELFGMLLLSLLVVLCVKCVRLFFRRHLVKRTTKWDYIENLLNQMQPLIKCNGGRGAAAATTAVVICTNCRVAIPINRKQFVNVNEIQLKQAESEQFALKNVCTTSDKWPL